MGKKRKNRKRKTGPTLPTRKICDREGNLIAKTKSYVVPNQVQSIPKILGADFDYDANNIEFYKNKLEEIGPRDRKIRVLIDNEASFLKTGFSTYGYELFKRLCATGEFELAELASYGGPAHMEPRARSLPWKYYHVLPTNQIEQQEYNSDPSNQFGKWKLTQVLIDFKPDILILLRDNWMTSHVYKNPLRGKFHLIHLFCVDGYPQDWEWIKDYQQADTGLAYSHFGKRVIENQSSWPLARAKGVNNTIKVTDVCQPGVDLNVFKPLPKGEAHRKFNIPETFRFCGTVMRNQPRKLFPRIIESFSLFKQKYPEESQNVNLLLHTSVEDVGWKRGAGILETIERQGVAQFVFFSYICTQCKHMAISTWIGSPTQCPKCKCVPQPDRSGGFRNPNTQIGYDPEHFNYIYNLMDVYIQGSIAEGDGMPINEARSCGVPVLCSDYSAMYEKARNGGALPIENDSIWNEPSEGCLQCGYTQGGTMQWRSHFSREDLAKKLALLFGNEVKRRKMSKEARICAEKYYDWDLTALKWHVLLRSINIKDRSKTWDTKELIKIPTEEAPPVGLSNEDWLVWCYKNILRRDGIDANGKRTWMQNLEAGMDRNMLEAHFRSLMKDNIKVAEALANPNSNGMTPMEKIALEVEEVERGNS